MVDGSHIGTCIRSLILGQSAGHIHPQFRRPGYFSLQIRSYLEGRIHILRTVALVKVGIVEQSLVTVIACHNIIPQPFLRPIE